MQCHFLQDLSILERGWNVDKNFGRTTPRVSSFRVSLPLEFFAHSYGLRLDVYVQRDSSSWVKQAPYPLFLQNNPPYLPPLTSPPGFLPDFSFLNHQYGIKQGFHVSTCEVILRQSFIFFNGYKKVIYSFLLNKKKFKTGFIHSVHSEYFLDEY